MKKGIKKQVFVKISKELEDDKVIKADYVRLADKWKGQVKTYKTTKTDNNQSGNGRTNWQFYEDMHRILGTAPEINAFLPLHCDSGENAVRTASPTPSPPSANQDQQAGASQSRNRHVGKLATKR